MSDKVDHHTRRAREMRELQQDHQARLALMPKLVEATNLSTPEHIKRATASNADRARQLVTLCQRYSLEVQTLHDRHTREQDEERGCRVNQEYSPPAESTAEENA